MSAGNIYLYLDKAKIRLALRLRLKLGLSSVLLLLKTIYIRITAFTLMFYDFERTEEEKRKGNGTEAF